MLCVTFTDTNMMMIFSTEYVGPLTGLAMGICGMSEAHVI